ncbi:hypothetical protein L596_016217 [Steinernema carpocapsae]|uniref:Uncharacterized protein n=1 Tax=Steinernema carpocapsae TaxID=34508 RepID=A0A4U5NHF8_STECR|nr:hypothetical protein L596_016217 [Steinernema carpocapsae]
MASIIVLLVLLPACFTFFVPNSIFLPRAVYNNMNLFVPVDLNLISRDFNKKLFLKEGLSWRSAPKLVTTCSLRFREALVLFLIAS